MDILKAFKLDNNEFEINIQGDYNNPLFQANQIASLLGYTSWRKTLSSFDDDEKVVSKGNTLGGLQNIIFLTEIGLYRLLGLSKKPIARIFQKWVHNILKELRLNGKYELQKSIESEKILIEKRLENQRHHVLLKAFDKKNIIYLTKIVELSDGYYVIKLGWTDNSEDRDRTLRLQFGQCIFQDIFECYRNRDFEKKLKSRPEIINYAYKEEINGHKSTETLRLNDESYKEIIKIIEKNIDFYQGFNPEQFIKVAEIKKENKKLDLENKKLDLQMLSLQLIEKGANPNLVENVLSDNNLQKISNEILEVNLELQDDDISVSDNDDYDDSTEFRQPQTNIPRKNTRNRKVQQYDPSNFELIKTFDGLMDVLRTLPEMSKQGVKDACLKNTIYRNYRWYFIERNAENIKYEIPPTVEITSSIPKFIAMLNITKTRIENVFANLQQAAENINSKRKQTICDAIQHDRLVREKYYFKYFENCSDELRNEYLSRAILPEVILPKGTKIAQIDMNTQQQIKIFTSINEVLKKFCISREKLKTVCANGEPHKGYYWRYVE
jgi:prophage antirepressor-like protein